jgi:hypothetical protein
VLAKAENRIEQMKGDERIRKRQIAGVARRKQKSPVSIEVAETAGKDSLPPPSQFLKALENDRTPIFSGISIRQLRCFPPESRLRSPSVRSGGFPEQILRLGSQ